MRHAPARPIESIKPRVQGGGMGIINAYLAWLAGKPTFATEETLTLRRNMLRRLDAELPCGITETCAEDLRAWLYRPGWEANTRATYYRGIKSFYRWATDPHGPWLDINPAEGLEPAIGPDGVARPVTDEQLQKVIDEAAEPFRTWAIIAAYNGLRCIEISRVVRPAPLGRRTTRSAGRDC